MDQHEKEARELFDLYGVNPTGVDREYDDENGEREIPFDARRDISPEAANIYDANRWQWWVDENVAPIADKSPVERAAAYRAIGVQFGKVGSTTDGTFYHTSQHTHVIDVRGHSESTNERTNFKNGSWADSVTHAELTTGEGGISVAFDKADYGLYEVVNVYVIDPEAYAAAHAAPPAPSALATVLFAAWLIAAVLATGL